MKKLQIVDDLTFQPPHRNSTYASQSDFSSWDGKSELNLMHFCAVPSPSSEQVVLPCSIQKSRLACYSSFILFLQPLFLMKEILKHRINLEDVNTDIATSLSSVGIPLHKASW